MLELEHDVKTHTTVERRGKKNLLANTVVVPVVVVLNTVTVLVPLAAAPAAEEPLDNEEITPLAGEVSMLLRLLR